MVSSGSGRTITRSWNSNDQQWQRADEIDPGESLLTADGTMLIAAGIDWNSADTDTAYNLTVDDLHTYFAIVIDQEVLVHNTCGPTPDFSNMPERKRRQMARRGWSEQDVIDVVANPNSKHQVPDLATGKPATAYAMSSNEYVVLNDRTGAVVQVSDKKDPNWIPEWEISRP